MKKQILILIPLSVFIFVVFKIEPPKDWITASYFQIFIFFTPLLLIVTFFADLFINYLPKSFLFGLAFVVLAVLQALGLLNIITGAILVIITYLTSKFFPKTRLTFFTKIPKLSAMRHPEHAHSAQGRITHGSRKRREK